MASATPFMTSTEVCANVPMTPASSSMDALFSRMLSITSWNPPMTDGMRSSATGSSAEPSASLSWPASISISRHLR